MGIKGLMKFMKVKDCCEWVRLSDIADAYRNKTGKEPVLVVDYSSSIFSFYTSSPGIMAVSGELKNFLENLKTFVNNCKELGIELKFFEHGKRPSYKYTCWVETVAKQTDEIRSVYSGQTNTFSGIPGACVLYWVASDYLLLKNNFKFSRAIHEGSRDIIKYLKAEDTFAVLTRNSDLIVVDNVHYCLIPDDLNLQSMIFLNFNRSKLAKVLQINASQLPLFASLCHLQNSDLLNLFKEKEINIREKFFGVAELIKNLTSREELVQYIFSLKEPVEVTDLERRLNFYFGQEEDVRHTAQNHWDEILKFAEERHGTGKIHVRILSIIQDKINFYAPTCENILISSPEYALLTIRKRIYGILFFEHPNSLIFVTEIWHDCPQEGFTPRLNLRTIIVERRPHPGLLKIWSLENSNDLKASRLTMFCEAINDKLTANDFSSLNIPVEYVIPILTTFYLLWEFDNRIKELEVETILIQAVLAKRLTHEEICQLPEEFDTEALNLTGWVLAIFDCLSLLNSVCGEPFCQHKTNLINFFDGKVMHYVYGKMKQGESPWASFGQYEEEYKPLISVLYELGRLCGHVEPKGKLDSIPNEDTAD